MEARQSDSECEELCPYPGKAKSIVWMYFGFRRDKISKKVNLTKAVCKLCKKAYTNNGNTTNFRAHLLREHPNESQTKPEAETDPATKITPATTTSRLSVADAGRSKTFPLSRTRTELITDAVSNYIVINHLPINTVEDDSFKNLLATLDPKYAPPSGTAFANSLREKHKAVRAEIADHLRDVDVSITHDSWVNVDAERYETTACRYITKSWDLQCKVLGTSRVDEPHSVETLAEIMGSLQSHWHFNDPVVVTDDESNEIEAFEALKWERLNSIGHMINSTMKVGLKEISCILDKGRFLVAYFHRNPSAMGVLFEKQVLLLSNETYGHKLIKDCPQLWDSTLDMLCRLSEQTLALHAVATDTRYGAHIKGKLYSFAEQAMVGSIISVFKAFKVAAVLLSSETQPTISMALPTFVKLERALQVQDDDIATVVKMKEAMMVNLKDRRKSNDREYYLLASLLDPRTKLLGFVSDEDRVTARHQLVVSALNLTAREAKIKQEPEESPSTSAERTPGYYYSQLGRFSDHADEHNPASDFETTGQKQNESCDEPPVKKIKPEPSQDEWLSDIISTEGNHARLSMSPEEMVIKEVDRYIDEEQQIPQNDDPLLWWSKKETFYPNIAQIAKHILAIPASSTPSGRTFNLETPWMSLVRSKLSSDDVDLLVFLHKNTYA